jgi:sugar lactone lactonase YvrE
MRRPDHQRRSIASVLAILAAASVVGCGQVSIDHSGVVAPLMPTSTPMAPFSAPGAPVEPGPTTTTAPGNSIPAAPPASPFAGGLLIADRENGRLLLVDAQKNILWEFPVPGGLPAGQRFSADDAFLSPDGRTITANEEDADVVVRIDVASRDVVWEYGRYGFKGSAPGYLNTPDDAYPLADGGVVVSDIGNCRIVEISPARTIVRQWGQTDHCGQNPPTRLASPNGDTPLPDGGMLVTEIAGARVIRLDAAGSVVFNIHIPARYPSDAQLDAQGNVVVADYSSPGAVLCVTPTGKLLWRYSPPGGLGRLNHPSLAMPMPNGLVAVNDDFRNRVVFLDPVAGRIVWQYGVTDRPGRGAGSLNLPDGIDPIPPGLLGAFTVPGASVAP